MKLFDQKDRSVILFLLLISLILVSSWFRKGNLFLGAEEGVPFYNLHYSLHIYSSTWLEQFLGVAYLTDIVKIPYFSLLVFLNYLGISNFTLQVGTFFLLLSGGSLGCYFLLKAVLVRDTKTIMPALFGAVFYLLNPYSIGDIWSRGIYSQFFAYLYYPVFLWCYVLFLETKKWFYLVLGWLISFGLSAAMGNPSYAISLWVLMGIYLVYYLFENRGNRRELVYTVLGFLSYLIGWIVINSWWLVTFIKFASEAYLTTGSGFSNALESLEAVSRQAGFLNTIRLFHAIRFGEDFYGKIYDNFLLIVVSWLLPLILVASVYFYKLKPFKFLGGLFLVGLIVCLGTTGPFGFLFMFLFEHLSVVQVFRNPYEKFGLVYLLAYSGLFGLGMTAIWQLVKNRSLRWKSRVVGILLLLTCGILVWPIWSGDVIGWGTQASVPDRYSQFDSWQKKQNINSEVVLFLPFLPSLGASYNWIGGDYHGGDPLYQMINTTVVTQAGINPYLNSLKEQIGRMDISGGLALIRVGWIANRPDVVSEQKDDLQKIMDQKSNGLIYAGGIDGINVYHLEKQMVILEVGVFNNLIPVKDFPELFNKANQFEIGNTGFLLEGQNRTIPNYRSSYSSAIVSQRKINSSRFFLQFKNSEAKLIYLSKTFNPQWKIIPTSSEAEAADDFVNNIKLLIKPKFLEQNHYVVNGYANLWAVPADQSKNIVIVYMPELVKDILWRVSLFAIWIRIIALFYYVLILTRIRK